MNLKNKGIIFILSSPSGGGKSSISKQLLITDKNLEPSISITTRKPRLSEQENISYFFKNEQEFLHAIADDTLLEYAKIYDHYYGTPKQYVEDKLSKKIDLILDIDWQGAKQIKEKMPNEVVTIFILPPNIEILKNRLIARAEDHNDVIKHRIEEATREISHAKYYDYVVLNDDLTSATLQVRSIIDAERCKVYRSNIL
ncbi:MAG: guanylate kinase [Rickettsiaceae bacterium]|nr:MAG: guanylate kinase [Rickettsiaceae bacterium]